MNFKIYFAASIRGGTENREVVNQIIALLKYDGHTVLSEDLFTGIKEKVSDEEIYIRDTHMIDECDLVIADLTVPSSGVGFEVAYALYKADKPVIAVAKNGSNPTAMIVGCKDIEEKIYFYEDAEWLVEHLRELFNWHKDHSITVKFLQDAEYPNCYVRDKHRKQITEIYDHIVKVLPYINELFGHNIRLEYWLNGSDLEYENNIGFTVWIWQNFEPEEAFEKLDSLNNKIYELDEHTNSDILYCVHFNLRFNT